MVPLGEKTLKYHKHSVNETSDLQDSVKEAAPFFIFYFIFYKRN